jgi:hypothetical protein
MIEKETDYQQELTRNNEMGKQYRLPANEAQYLPGRKCRLSWHGSAGDCKNALL